ncbi:class I SAM-dependent methyltransferase [Aspergillus undulatus]|uniref:class I SAM-dependent methyltransferase n=1 Tax=Aspergillus undulatus TaxID=1810928 RepID=UPI003CCE145C
MVLPGFDTSVWYQPHIGPRLAPCIERVCTDWSCIPTQGLRAHLQRIRNQAWPLGEYPCIGLWMFLLPGLAGFPQFESIVARARQPQSVIQMRAVDVVPRLWELGFELFRDKDKMHAQFIEGDFLAAAQGKADVVIALQFLHLFSWERQIAAAERIVALSKPGTIFAGYQQGRKQARETMGPWGIMFVQNLELFMSMWAIVEEATQTRWTKDARGVELRNCQGIEYVLTRVS